MRYSTSTEPESEPESAPEADDYNWFNTPAGVRQLSDFQLDEDLSPQDGLKRFGDEHGQHQQLLRGKPYRTAPMIQQQEVFDTEV